MDNNTPRRYAMTGVIIHQISQPDRKVVPLKRYLSLSGTVRMELALLDHQDKHLVSR